MFDLSFDFTDAPGGGITGSIEFATDRYDRASAQVLVERLQRVLVAVAEDPSVVVSRVDVLAPDECARLLAHEAAVPIPEWSIVDLFTAQVGRTPDAVALVAGGRSWTFAELDDWSSRLAGVLAGRGVGRGSVVALAVPRSLTVPAIFGVLKAGAAYLPLDTFQPRKRIAAVLDDAAPALVLTTAGTSLPSGPARLLLDDRRLFDGPGGTVARPGL
ncbi:AMP-binding protein, partial [Micromonospora carbonacea]|uniref:AMP-binding protein n=1 Tax=Micromonospora carbonacea TaxID=47853 RepID=UPI003D722D86